MPGRQNASHLNTYTHLNINMEKKEKNDKEMRFVVLNMKTTPLFLHFRLCIKVYIFTEHRDTIEKLYLKKHGNNK